MLDFDYLIGRLSAFSPTVILAADSTPAAVWLDDGGSIPGRALSGQLIRIMRGDAAEELLPGMKGGILFLIGGRDCGRYCDSGIPAVRFPESTSAPRLFDAISDALAAIGRLREARSGLYGALEAHKSIDVILQIAEEVFGNPVAVFDISSRLICGSESFLTDNSDAAWQDYKKHGSISMEFAQRFSYDDLFMRVMESPDPFFFDLSGKGLTKRLLSRVLLGGVSVGHCTVLERNTPLSELDVEIMRSLTSVIGAVLERNNYLPYKNTVDGVILQELYTGKIADRTSFLKRAAPFKWSMKSNWFVINIFIGEKRRSALNLSTIFLDSLTQMLPTGKCSARFLIEDDRVIALLNTSCGEITDLLAELNHFLEAENMMGTVSRRFSDIMEFRKHVDFTERLIETALISGKHFGLYDGDALFFQNAAFVLDRFSDLQCHCLSKLIDIRQRDADEGTDYYNTVKTYLESGRSATTCAEKLFMHRNTIIRRIERFEHITGFDLSGEDVYKLYFSYKLLEFKEMLGSAPHDTLNRHGPGAK